MEDGELGWVTINGLIRALHIKLGIQDTADNFGAGTIARFNQQYPNGMSEQTDSDKSESNVYGIIQGGLWCKGIVPDQVKSPSIFILEPDQG